MIEVLVALSIVVLIWMIVLYNRIVYIRQLKRNAWADVDVYLKRRAELIPNLSETVKAYAQHEQTTLDKVAQARTNALNTKGPTHAKANAENELGEQVTRLFILAEQYPELKASTNFLTMQKELIHTEKLIANARQYYNACIRDYNIKIEAFPSSIVAGILGIKHEDFFELESIEERLVPSVSNLS